ncbi:magnesium transporter NIPA-domain-containing protein [Mrakia frigida]|uniref:magnesium transporter NIPA-domain-containing protein n=1 Tax=Mrakia frigida TaxID=29902 RepID=UPI003FCC1E13
MSSTIASASASASASAVAETAQPASFKIVGLILAIMSGVLIGTSFVVKKKGLLRAQSKSGAVAGEGHAYLKDWMWWLGMIMMIVGEICNFVAYAFTEAILVTPLGALSVVVCAILSHFFLKEKLSFFGWLGCALCIIGATIIALNSPEQQSVTHIRPFMALFISPGFLVWASLLIIAAVFAIFYLVPRYGKTHMLVHIGICSVIGGLSVSCTQGLGASIVTSVQGDNQVTYWFFWFLFVFVIFTLLTEINYLNKALELFNTAMVTPTYFVTFTTFTLVTSIILYKGLKATPIQLVTMFLGFIVICVGITILQMSKVDPETLVTLDRRSTLLLAAQRPTETEEKTGIEDPSMDALRGGYVIGSIMRARSRRASVNTNGSGRGRVSSTAFNPNDPFSLGMTRYQLSDTPSGPNQPWSNPDTDKPPSNSNSNYLSPHGAPALGAPLRSGTSLRFDPEDTVHRVGRAGHPEEAQTSHQLHSEMLSPHSSFSKGSHSDHHPPAVGTFSSSSDQGNEGEERRGSNKTRFNLFGPRPHGSEPPLPLSAPPGGQY